VNAYRIDWTIVWTVAVERLPALELALEQAFAALDAEDQDKTYAADAEIGA